MTWPKSPSQRTRNIRRMTAIVLTIAGCVTLAVRSSEAPNSTAVSTQKPTVSTLISNVAATGFDPLAGFADVITLHEAETATILRALEPVPEPPVEEEVYVAPAEPHASGARSYAWWEAIANCESGNTNAWRTGFYGLEADHPIGHLSKAEQLAWAEDIYASHGDGAWGCSSVAWGAVPSG